MQVTRSYTKSELAQSYGVTVHTLTSKWLVPILPKLELTGYKKFDKIFTPNQVQIIVDHLGDFEE